VILDTLGASVLYTFLFSFSVLVPAICSGTSLLPFHTIPSFSVCLCSLFLQVGATACLVTCILVQARVLWRHFHLLPNGLSGGVGCWGHRLYSSTCLTALLFILCTNFYGAVFSFYGGDILFVPGDMFCTLGGCTFGFYYPCAFMGGYTWGGGSLPWEATFC
jgi:hypothetical protein